MHVDCFCGRSTVGSLFQISDDVGILTLVSVLNRFSLFFCQVHSPGAYLANSWIINIKKTKKHCIELLKHLLHPLPTGFHSLSREGGLKMF